MRQGTSSRGRVYDIPETVEEQTSEYRGFKIDWTAAPVPAGSGCEWAAFPKDDPEWGSILANTVQELREEIDEYWLQQEETA